ncbi:MAG: hypothetical protein JF888_00295 [Candidatus Dormibacteraeota bacterium]|uniref:SHSP domain-containing protein n=1 Tax=Candidatus Dormiibacter inghamiae TaxID=3127013 RepID=A0A934KET6_9BACT|nr:hypothetical protein [Candidatus Dormibacteraeota bacterium]
MSGLGKHCRRALSRRQDASFDNGVLTVAVPIAPKAQPVKISVGRTESQRKLGSTASTKS